MRYLVLVITSAILVLALPDLLMAQELPQRSASTPEAKKSQESDPSRESSRTQRSTPTAEAKKNQESDPSRESNRTQRSTPTAEAKKSQESDPSRQSSRTQRSTPTPEARKIGQSDLKPVEIAVEIGIGISDSVFPPNSLMLSESVSLSDESVTNSMSINEIVPIHDQIGASNQSMKASDTQENEANQKTATKKSASSSDCLPESGGQSSFGSIGLLTAPIALYIWRRMQKLK